MCGVTGIFAPDGRAVDATMLAAMNATLRHRGPDEDGVFHDTGIGLAMRRLSVIGLADGQQPLASEDGDVVVVMNGEIYNHRALRADLAARGHRFASGSDVEVAVHLYEERGAAFVEDLRGMFAYALWDRRRRRLLLGRDRLGKKPLYWAERGGVLLFGSEIKALLASGLLADGLDADALDALLATGFVAGERTLFPGVQVLPPGCQLEADAAGVRVQRYWQLPAPQAAPAGLDPAAAAQRVHTLLDDAVQARLMAEVPLGAFLSGGVDSSAVVALMRRHLAGPIDTFAVGFDDPRVDELAHARAAAARYETRHHEVVVRGCSPELLAEITWHHDEPAADPAIVPTLVLARFARQRVTVALTGEGGDELFAGYRHHAAAARLAASEGAAALRLAAAMLGRLEPIAGGLAPRRAWKALWVASLPAFERPRGLLSLFTDRERRALRPGAVGAYPSEAFRALQAPLNGIDAVGRSLWVDAKTQLAAQLLMKVDKATMAASLEARCPFLDQALVEYVAALPTAWKRAGGAGKLLLRQALRGVVDDALLDRPKQGFEVPVRAWLLGDLRALAGDLLLADGAAVHDWLAPVAVRGVWTRMSARPDTHAARQCWALLAFAVWLQGRPGGDPPGHACGDRAGRGGDAAARARDGARAWTGQGGA